MVCSLVKSVFFYFRSQPDIFMGVGRIFPGVGH